MKLPLRIKMSQQLRFFSIDLLTLKISYPRVYLLKIIRSEIPALRLDGATSDIIP